MITRPAISLISLCLLAAAAATVPGCKSSHKYTPPVATEGLSSDQIAYFRAAAKGQPGVVEEYLGPVDINARDAKGQTAVYLASAGGHDSMVRWLAARGADLNAAEATKGRTPLHAAAAGGHDDVVKVLATLGANIDAKDNDGATPLDLAQRGGNADAAQELFNARARASSTQTNGGGNNAK